MIPSLFGFVMSASGTPPCIFSDTDEEKELIMHHCEQKGIRCVVNNAYTDGGIGAADLANAVVEEIENNPSRLFD